MPLKKILAIFICIIFLIQMLPVSSLAAPSSVPDRTIIYTTDPNKPATGYTAEDGYYIDVNWQDLSSTVPQEWDYVYYNVYIQEISRTGVASPYTVKLKDLTSAKAKLRNLKSGSVYNIYVTAYYKKVDVGSTITSGESEKSNIVTVMTDIQVYAYPYGANQLKIEWDDVWMAGGRISYNLYIADDSQFSGTQPIPISSSQIGSDGKVNVESAAGRLSYIHTVDNAGRVYYIKIKPELGTLPIFYNSESDTVAASSFILVKTTKMYETSAGTVWKLDWSEVAVAFKDIKIAYQIYKVDTNNNNLPQYMLSVDNNSTYLTVSAEDADNYYIVRALVTNRLGEDIYADWNVKIESDKVYLKDSEVPAVPISPVLVDEIILPPDTVVESYTDSLKPDSATVLWELPKKGNGDIDYDVSYDIWMITDPQKINNPDTSSLIAENVKIGDILVTEESNILGAKYQITSLVPNSTYYFRIVAKKTYVEYVDGDIENVTLTSVPATRLVITPPRDNGDTPVAIAAPPLKVKVNSEGKNAITDTTATVTIKNKWYEKFNSTYTNPRWEYYEPDKIKQSDGSYVFMPNDQTVIDDAYGETWRKVEYDGGITIDVGAIKVSDLPENFDYNNLNDIDSYPLNKVKGFSVTPNDPTEIAANNPDSKKHNVDIQLTELDPNTTYVIWVRAIRSSTGTISNASDPIFLTTNTDGTYTPEKPTVPYFNYGYAGDTYVELGWAYNTSYVYNVKYGKAEDITQAKDEITVTGAEMLTKKYLTITDLDQSTDYYFWIQAQYTYDGTDITSDFGDAYHLKTNEFTPPNTPYGFGIKGNDDSVTKESITYEWMTSGSLEYILEIADNIDYTNAVTIEVGSVSQYQVTGLKSNTRYYARLYAYDTNTELKSIPTQSVIAKTLKSKDDYDSDEDTENVITGDFIVKDPYAAGAEWNIYIIGVNADRFIEEVKKSQRLEYIIDLKNPPDSILTSNVTMSGKIFTELSRMGRTLTIDTVDFKVSFGPGSLDGSIKSGEVYDNYKISLSSGISDSSVKTDNINVRTKVGRINVGKQEGTAFSDILDFEEAPLVSYKIEDLSWYNEANTYGYYIKDMKWVKSSLELKQDVLRDKNSMKFKVDKPTDFFIGQQVSAPYTDILGHWASDPIQKLIDKKELKSVKGTLFKPDASATIGDTVKMVFDVFGYDYSSNYMLEAYRAGIIDKNDALNPNSYCTTEKALNMVIAMYEKSAGIAADPKGMGANMFSDMSDVSSQYRNNVYFAVESGIYPGRDKNNLKPGGNITRAELAVVLLRYLEFVGVA